MQGWDGASRRLLGASLKAGCVPFSRTASCTARPPPTPHTQTHFFLQMCAALEALRDAVPRRSLGGLLERYPAILTAPVATWVDFLGSFGFQRLAVQE